MSFEVPNAPEVTYLDQAEPDARDFLALGYRPTGVLSGCDIVNVSSLSVSVDAGVVLVNGSPYQANAAVVTVQPGGSAPRFDLVVATVVSGTAAISVVRGTENTNCVFPSLNPLTQCLLYSIYVPESATSISLSNVVDKRIIVEPTFKRTYSSPDDEAIKLSSGGDSFTIKADGELNWGSSMLKKISTSVLRLVGSLAIEQPVDSSADYVLKLEAFPGFVGKILTIVSSITEEAAAWFDHEGRVYADNFKWGVGSPEGVVIGSKGDLYIDRSKGVYDSIWYKNSGQRTTTGWVSLNTLNSAPPQLLPTGTVIAWAGASVSDKPDGFVIADGASYSISDPTYYDLYSIIGTSFGSSGLGTFRVPDLRGRTIFGLGDGVFSSLGSFIGSMTKNVSFTGSATLAGVPPHTHGVNVGYYEEMHIHDFVSSKGVGAFAFAGPPAKERSVVVDVTNLPSGAQLKKETIYSVSQGTIAARVDFAMSGVRIPVVFSGTGTSGSGSSVVTGNLELDVLNPGIALHYLIKL